MEGMNQPKSFGEFLQAFEQAHIVRLHCMKAYVQHIFDQLNHDFLEQKKLEDGRIARSLGWLSLSAVGAFYGGRAFSSRFVTTKFRGGVRALATGAIGFAL
jgi:hypothetical protein